MVTRKNYSGKVWGPSQRISLDEAIRICTVNGAYASFEESEKGSITPGQLGDFVILAQDPHDVDADAIKEIPVARTVVGGKTTHEG
jgi:predicted amidohydrolase YtcJ